MTLLRYRAFVAPASAAAFVVAALAASVAAQPSNRNAPRTVPTHDAKTFFDTTAYSGASFTPDESKILLTTDMSGVFNAVTIPIAGGKPEPKTASTTSAVFAVSAFPNDERILYSSDQGGNELNHVYVLEKDGTARDLTPGDKLKAMFMGWTKDRKSFFVGTNERDPKYFDVYRYATDGYARELVFKNEAGYQPGDVSGDGRFIALSMVKDNSDGDVYLFDTTKPAEKPKHVTPHEGKATHSPVTFTPDDSKLYYSTDAHGDFSQVWSYDLASGRHAPVVQADWDVMYVAFSESGRYRVTGVNQDARTVITVLDTKSGKEVKFPELPGGDITGVTISRSETKMAIYVNGDTSPSNLFVLDLASGKHTQLTNALNPKISSNDLVQGEVVRYKSFDGIDVPAILYRPWAAAPGNKVPALVWVHGGPGGQSRHGYGADIQHLVNHGYAILAVNNRGSSGYGKKFFHLDDKNHGEGDLQDCIHGRKYLSSLDWVDGSKIGIIGGSYGGYMVAAALALTPDAFDVGVNIFGVTNWLRTLQSIPPWWASFRDSLYAEMGDPATDEARLRKISPLFHAHNIKKPLMVVQGANDPRVLKVESDEIVAAAKKNGVPVEYIVFPDEGHGFLKKENRVKSATGILAFLDTHLKGTKN